MADHFGLEHALSRRSANQRETWSATSGANTIPASVIQFDALMTGDTKRGKLPCQIDDRTS